jgi:hypothetical protein
MLTGGHDSQIIQFSARLYRALTSAYPPEFRREYGDLMVQAFRDSCRRAAGEGGAGAVLVIWFWTAIDFLKSIVEEYANGGVHMTREQYIKLSGWAMMVGALAFFVGLLAGSRPEYSPYNAVSLPIDRYANQVGWPLAFIGAILISLGILGLFFRYGRQAGAFARVCLGISFVSGLASAAGMVGLAVSESEPWWSLFFISLTIQFLAFALFGAANLRQRVLSRGNVIPLLAGISLPVLVALNLGLGYEPSDSVLLACFLVGFGGFLVIGYLLLSDSRPAFAAPGAA